MNNGPDKKCCLRQYDKVMGKIGRLRQKYSRVSRQYTISVVFEEYLGDSIYNSKYNSKRDAIKLMRASRCRNKYSFLLFDDALKVDLIWNCKTAEAHILKS
ncbi:hypothetical protein BMS3Bbin14_00081 [bacterium BMS3Bbin14]|nr:hypothetical protein BMS3Bbin14_00081 [bacterium BMS3Bbin14]